MVHLSAPGIVIQIQAMLPVFYVALRRTITTTTLSQQNGHLTLSTGKETPVVNLTGPSQIRALTFQVPASEMASFGNARLLIYWDGETQPDVSAPIKFLVGDGAGVYQPANRPLVQGWTAGANTDANGAMNFNLYWPMPFSSHAHIAMIATYSLECYHLECALRAILRSSTMVGYVSCNLH